MKKRKDHVESRGMKNLHQHVLVDKKRVTWKRECRTTQRLGRTRLGGELDSFGEGEWSPCLLPPGKKNHKIDRAWGQRQKV